MRVEFRGRRTGCRYTTTTPSFPPASIVGRDGVVSDNGHGGWVSMQGRGRFIAGVRNAMKELSASGLVYFCTSATFPVSTAAESIRSGSLKVLVSPTLGYLALR